MVTFLSCLSFALKASLGLNLSKSHYWTRTSW